MSDAPRSRSSVRMRASALLLVVLHLVFFPGTVAAAALAPDEVVESAAALDGEMLTLTGEAIGESLHADSTHRWVNVLGGGTAIGVFVLDSDAERISRFGDHSGVGDTVEVTGRFNRACEQHAGEMDIHAESLLVVSEGAPTNNPVEGWQGLAGAGLLLVALVEYRLLGYLRESRR